MELHCKPTVTAGSRAGALGCTQGVCSVSCQTPKLEEISNPPIPEVPSGA